MYHEGAHMNLEDRGWYLVFALSLFSFSSHIAAADLLPFAQRIVMSNDKGELVIMIQTDMSKPGRPPDART